MRPQKGVSFQFLCSLSQDAMQELTMCGMLEMLLISESVLEGSYLVRGPLRGRKWIPLDL